MPPEWQAVPRGRYPKEETQPARGTAAPGVAKPHAVWRSYAGRSDHADAVPRLSV